ncbi:MAG: YebC/PmpR family DNA-binding transcriptional regulator [Candidatus Sungbacteria bacterium]|nr:YebC/PmpR family DNA-binding transcriptional regulator [Candidatus Sungbacteria bacterium]
MSGHSKWAQIKRKKSLTDAKRGNLFSKLARAISLAATGGQDPAMNSKLRLAILHAKSFNMPSDNIERAVKRAATAKESSALHEVMYEAYASGGSAILIEGITDNKNRMVAEIKHILAKHGGKLAEHGAVRWMFERVGIIVLERDKNRLLGPDDAELKMIDAGAEEVVNDPEGTTIITSPEKRDDATSQLEKIGFHVSSSSDEWRPKTTENLAPPPQALIDELESNDDIQNVWSNAEIIT